MDTLHAPQGSFALQRYPDTQDANLRAWDAADEYLLSHLAEADDLPPAPRTLILNESFGALSTALSDWQPTLISDSLLCHRGTEANLRLNGIDPSAVCLLDPLEQPEGAPDLVLIKVPKTLALLEDQLCRLRPQLGPDTRVIAAGMVKHLPKGVFELLEKLIGPVSTSLARKKARLLFATPVPATEGVTSPYPSRYRLEGDSWELINHANVFCRDKLDIGTRFLLQHLPEGDAPLEIVDLGCGNGVVGIMAAWRNPNARLNFVDESFMAVASAEANFRAILGANREAHFLANDCLDGFAPDSADLILNNPPFHQQQVVGDRIAWRMFRQSLNCLRPGGELRVIGNRHLGYHVKLKKLFGNCDIVASNSKFVILRAQKRSRQD